MSRENVEIVRRAFEAFQRDGIEGILPFLDEEIELKGTFSSCCASDSQGREAASSWTSWQSRQSGIVFRIVVGRVALDPDDDDVVVKPDGVRLLAKRHARPVRRPGAGGFYELPHRQNRR